MTSQQKDAFWYTIAIVVVVMLIGLSDAAHSQDTAQQKFTVAQRCMWIAIGTEAVQTIRHGGFDPITGEAVDPALTYETFAENIKPLAAGNPAYQRTMEETGAWVYANIPEVTDPVDAAFIAGNDCLLRSLRFAPPKDVEPLSGLWRRHRF